MFDGPDNRRNRRPMDTAYPARMFSTYSPLRGIPVRTGELVRQGILRRVPYQESPKRHEYILTQKGLDLYPIMMAIVHWGDTHMVDERGRPLLHQHRNCGKNFDPVMVCSECGEPVLAKEVHTHPGPGARRPLPKKGVETPAPKAKTRRRAA